MFFYHGVKRKRKMDRRFTTEMKFSDFKAAGGGARGGGGGGEGSRKIEAVARWCSLKKLSL